ncbi:COG1848 Predicted nucleic acid-binding protein, contains PIN domain [Fimbriimonadaceae bacterium]
MISLLDINVLLALLDASHVHHDRAKEWLLSQDNARWASCPLTQNGFVRIISQAAYPGRVSIGRATQLLRSASESDQHVFWDDDISLLDGSIFDYEKLHGSKQITDAYLLALATKNCGKLVALDRSISLACVRGAENSNLLIL